MNQVQIEPHHEVCRSCAVCFASGKSGPCPFFETKDQAVRLCRVIKEYFASSDV